MNLLTKFFNLFKTTPTTPYDNWSVEYYPETDRYYPVWKQNRYIKKNSSTGIYEFREPFLFMFADYGKTEEDAWKIVDLVNEQRFKQNVIVLKKRCTF